jgi:hypothetical protein
MLTMSLIFLGLLGLLLAAGLAINLYLRTHRALSPQPANAKQQSAQLQAALFPSYADSSH